MRALPEQKLDPRIKNVWRINDAIWIILGFVCCFVPFAIVVAVDPGESWAGVVCIALVAALVGMLFIFLVILPPIRYVRWRYELSDEYLDIAKGIIWRKRYIIPFIRVQNTDTRQGPLLRMMGLASVTISTAAGSMEIPGLPAAEAETLRDQAAEFARLAKEDV